MSDRTIGRSGLPVTSRTGLKIPTPTLDQLEKLDGQVWKALAEFCGVRLAVLLVRVFEVNGYQTAVDDPHNHLRTVKDEYVRNLETAEVPGLDGRYVVVVYPYEAGEPDGYHPG